MSDDAEPDPPETAVEAAPEPEAELAAEPEAELAAEPAAEPAVDEAPAPAPKRGRAARSLGAVFGTLLIGLVAFVTGLILFSEVVMPRFVRQGGDVTVPDLSNLSKEQAEALLGRQGLRLSVTSERFDAATPRGFVITQDPEPGRGVKSGRRVSVAISLGEEFANIPELFGESLRGTRLLLDRAGLKAGAINRVVTSEVGPGLIVATEPPFGAVVPRGTTVNLLVCAASEPEAYVTPDLVGRDAQAAERELEALGFRVEVSGPGSNFARVEAQSPSPGARVLRGQTIALTVAGRLIQ